MSVRTQTGALTARWSVLIVLLTAAAIAALGWAYTNRVQQQTIHRTEQLQRDSDQRWCALLASLDQPAPAVSERGRQIQRQIHQLRASLGCARQ